jgi:beta-galactosidase
VFIYTNADSVELFLNGTSLGSKTIDAKPADANSAHTLWTVPFATGTLQAKATKGGTVAATDTVQTAGAAASLALTPDRTSITASGLDLSYVEVDVLDSKSVLVPKANNEISFTVTGAGTLVGVDNGDSTNHESYKGTQHQAFNGKAVAIIESTTTPGTVTVKATSGSLTAGSATITTTAS